MRRGWKILIGALVALAILLTVNTIALNQETKAADVTVSGGQILDLPGGALQVVEEGPTVGKLARRDRATRPPIVLLHCFGCSLHWWDRMVPLLAKRHRVIRIDLLGFGGSEKPKSGYSMEEQGRLVALVLGKLRVQGAVVVGHSLGFSVATALAAESSELVDRLVDIDAAPEPGFGGLPFLARLASAPVLGQALRRISPDFAVEDGYESAFAPGYDLGDFSDQIVDDYRAMTYTSYDRSPAEVDNYQEEVPLDQRIRTAAVPLLIIFGEHDQLYDDPEAAAQAYGDVPGARITVLPDAGHSPNVEKPAETSRLVLDFAGQAGG
ncbi:MAG TPA: alpha/beta hydrolase [Solirubrobacterales bacterium]|nr:alpha/beta hydrolase [Solirubrobacterales bacterium]